MHNSCKTACPGTDGGGRQRRHGSWCTAGIRREITAGPLPRLHTTPGTGARRPRHQGRMAEAGMGEPGGHRWRWRRGGYTALGATTTHTPTADQFSSGNHLQLVFISNLCSGGAAVASPTQASARGSERGSGRPSGLNCKEGLLSSLFYCAQWLGEDFPGILHGCWLHQGRPCCCCCCWGYTYPGPQGLGIKHQRIQCICCR